MSPFKKAVKESLCVKIALEGPAGSGKTKGALRLCKGMGGTTAVIDTENRSSCLYADEFDFDMVELEKPFSPEKYVELIEQAEKAGYDNLVIDSCSHEWEGEGGILELSDRLSKTEKSSFNAWAKLTPRHNQFVRKILDSKMNIICCFRTKTAYDITQQERNGRTVSVPQKIGTKPITREGFDYECTIVFGISVNNVAEATKDRTGLYAGIQKILDEDDGKKIKKYLNTGVERKTEAEPPVVTEKPDTEDNRKKGVEVCLKEWFKLTSPPLIGPEIDMALLGFIAKTFPTYNCKTLQDLKDMRLEDIKRVWSVIKKSPDAVKRFAEQYITTKKENVDA